MAMLSSLVVLHLRSSALLWVGLYLFLAFLGGLPYFAFHAIAIGEKIRFFKIVIALG